MEIINAIGRRKAAVARVYLRKGKGEVIINGKKLEDYFPTQHIQNKVTAPISMIEDGKSYDFKINVDGGGFRGQSEAIQLGIARAFVKLNEDNKPIFKAESMMTRDSRVVERKK
ncbi:UNVERIFIED_CONTAM: hypothetical protein GTU68_020011, partial [Idotea baltica]|nr:hypothetical protein [Idotea baltica]